MGGRPLLQWQGNRLNGRFPLPQGSHLCCHLCLSTASPSSPPCLPGAQIEAVRAALRERGRNAALAARTAREIGVSCRALLLSHNFSSFLTATMKDLQLCWRLG